jgi:DNA-binding GntR family transcriptional regulator
MKSAAARSRTLRPADPPAGTGRPSTLDQVIAGTIRERILAGAFAPGERLAEERLSAELGVSRVPVREALRHLAAEGLVVLRPRRGAVVVSHTPEEMADLVEVRATLEGLNARLAARRRDPRHAAMLERILAEASRITERSDLARIQEHNARFHEAIAAMADNSVLKGIVRALRDRTALLFSRTSRARVRESWDEHAGIVRAILSGNVELADRLASAHVYSSARPPEERTAKGAARPARALKRRTGS